MWSENSGQRAVLSISGKPWRVIQTCLESLCLKGYSSSEMQLSCISWFIFSLPSSLSLFLFPFLPPSISLSPPLSLSLCMHICTIESIWRPEDNLGVCVLTFHSSVLLVYCCACQAHWPASFRFFCLCLLSPHRGTGITDACFSARLHLVLEMQI